MSANMFLQIAKKNDDSGKKYAYVGKIQAKNHKKQRNGTNNNLTIKMYIEGTKKETNLSPHR